MEYGVAKGTGGGLFSLYAHSQARRLRPSMTERPTDKEEATTLRRGRPTDATERRRRGDDHPVLALRVPPFRVHTERLVSAFRVPLRARSQGAHRTRLSAPFFAVLGNSLGRQTSSRHKTRLLRLMDH